MKRKPFGARLVESMSEGLDALRRGEDLPATVRPSMPQPPALKSKQVLAIRTKLGLTQREFSELIVVSPKTVQSWEQGTRIPSGAALRVMQILSAPETLDPFLRFHIIDR